MIPVSDHDADILAGYGVEPPPGEVRADESLDAPDASYLRFILLDALMREAPGP